MKHSALSCCRLNLYILIWKQWQKSKSISPNRNARGLNICERKKKWSYTEHLWTLVYIFKWWYVVKWHLFSQHICNQNTWNKYKSIGNMTWNSGEGDSITPISMLTWYFHLSTPKPDKLSPDGTENWNIENIYIYTLYPVDVTILRDSRFCGYVTRKE